MRVDAGSSDRPVCGGLVVRPGTRRAKADRVTAALSTTLRGPSWIGANFWSRAGGPRMWSRYDAGLVRDELAVLAEHGLNVTRSFCFWPDFVPVAGSPRRRRRRPLRRLPRRARGARARDDPDVRRRAHVRRELGSALATREGPLPRRLARLPAGLARRGDRGPVRRASGDRRLARLERDAPVRGRRDERGDHGVGATDRSGGPLGGGEPADLARGRRLGRRGVRPRQRLLAARARAAGRLRRAARVPDAGRRGPAGPDGGIRVRAVCRLRQARRARGVRRLVRLRRRRQRRRLLPPGAVHDSAGRRARLARLEQLRLRRSARQRIPTATTCSRCTSA